MQLIIDGTTSESTRDEIVRYLNHCIEAAKGQLVYTSGTKARKAAVQAQVDLLTGIVHDIAGAKLHVNVLRKE